jgi:hypothetical protein
MTAAIACAASARRAVSSASEQNVGTVVDNVIIPFGNPVNSLAIWNASKC